MLDRQKVPYNKYLVVLCALNTPDSVITEGFKRRNLPPPDAEITKEIRLNMLAQMPDDVKAFYLSKKDLVAISSMPDNVLAFIKSTGIYDFIENQKGFGAAISCFDQMDLRLLMFTHILNDEPDSSIESSFLKMTKYPIHPDAIFFFKKYFCDKLYMDYMAWKWWIPTLRTVTQFEYDIYKECFDPRYSFDLIRWKIHADLGIQDADECLRQLTNYTYFRTVETMENASDSEYEMVHGWIEKFLKTYEKHKTLGKGKIGTEDNASIAENAIFELKRVRGGVVKLSDLDGGAPEISKEAVIDITPKKKALD